MFVMGDEFYDNKHKVHYKIDRVILTNDGIFYRLRIATRFNYHFITLSERNFINVLYNPTWCRPSRTV